MKVRAYRLELDQRPWLLLVDPTKFDGIPAFQQQHDWKPAGLMELGVRSPLRGLNVDGDLKAMGYAVFRVSADFDIL